MRGDQVFIPQGQDTIEVDDLVYLVVRNDELDSALKLFNIKEESLRRVIIVGAGRTGTALATALDMTSISAKIIENLSV